MKALDHVKKAQAADKFVGNTKLAVVALAAHVAATSNISMVSNKKKDAEEHMEYDNGSRIRLRRSAHEVILHLYWSCSDVSVLSDNNG